MTDRETILLVDDTPDNIIILNELLKDSYKTKIATNGEKALKIAFSDTPPDLILLDIMMPEMDGYEVCSRLKADNKTRDIPIVFITARSGDEDEARGLQLGAVDYITKPFVPELVKSRVRNQLELKKHRDHLEELVQERTAQLHQAFERIKDASLETIHRLSRAAEHKDEDTGAHILRMSNYSASIARKMGLNENVVERILYAAPMHDIGKIGTPDRILLKHGKLDPDEWEIMKEHATNGAQILSDSKQGFIRLGEVIALTHHEKWDGSGYPNGLKGSKIPLVGRIVAIADVFDALTTRRPYKEPFSLEKSYAIIQESKGNHFDPDVVDAFFTIEDEILAIKEKYQDEGKSLLYQRAGKAS